MSSLKAKKGSPEMAKKIGKNSPEKKKTGTVDQGCPPPPYTSPPRRSKQGRSMPNMLVPVSIPVSQLSPTFRSRLNIKQRLMPSDTKPSKLSPMKATHNLSNFYGSDTSITDPETEDVSTKATDHGKKED